MGDDLEGRMRKYRLVQRLRQFGVCVGWSKYENVSKGTPGRGARPRKVMVRQWDDGSWTVNMVDVPEDVAQEAIDCGMSLR